MDPVELTILMPCLNEAETLASCIAKAKIFLRNSNVKGEILIADNGSEDNSREIASSLGARVITVSERGYGCALQAGMNNAYGEYVIMGDSDDSYDFSDLMPFLCKLREAYELVVGNRFEGGIDKGAMPFLHRYLGNPVLSFIGRALFGGDIRDWHCGLRGYNVESMKKLALSSPGMEYASEMIILSLKGKLRVTEVPTVLHPDGRSGKPHLRTFRDGFRHLKCLLGHKFGR